MFLPYQKSASAEAPFSEHRSRFWPYLLSEKVMNFFWYKIWVIIFTKSAKLSDLGVPWVRNNRLLLDFFGRFKILLETLTFSIRGKLESFEDAVISRIFPHSNLLFTLSDSVISGFQRCYRIGKIRTTRLWWQWWVIYWADSTSWRQVARPGIGQQDCWWATLPTANKGFWRKSGNWATPTLPGLTNKDCCQI